MNPALDIIAAMRDLVSNGGKCDVRVASLALSEPEFATQASIGRFAERAGVSEPTISRFCRTLGCDGLRDFKVRLAQALAVSGRYIVPVGLPVGPPENAAPAAVRAAATDAVEQVCREVDPTMLAQAAKAICSAAMVRCFGAGGSSSMVAREFEVRLFRLGVNASATVDGELQRMMAAVANHRTVVVVFSISGQLQDQIDAVAIARRYGGATIAFTAPGSPLAEAAEMVFPFHIIEDSNVFRPSAARYAMLALADTLAMVVAEIIGESAVEHMRRIKHHIGQVRRDNLRLPLGD